MKRSRLKNMTPDELKAARKRTAQLLARPGLNRRLRRDRTKYLESLNREIYLRQFGPPKKPEDPKP